MKKLAALILVIALMAGATTIAAANSTGTIIIFEDDIIITTPVNGISSMDIGFGRHVTSGTSRVFSSHPNHNTGGLVYSNTGVDVGLQRLGIAVANHSGDAFDVRVSSDSIFANLSGVTFRLIPSNADGSSTPLLREAGFHSTSGAYDAIDAGSDARTVTISGTPSLAWRKAGQTTPSTQTINQIFGQHWRGELVAEASAIGTHTAVLTWTLGPVMG